MHRRFVVDRPTDSTGISGTGIVIEGCLFSNGKVAYAWTSDLKTMTWADSMEDLKEIVTHKRTNDTKIIWIDEEFVFE